jgi:hypothetical protein
MSKREPIDRALEAETEVVVLQALLDNERIERAKERADDAIERAAERTEREEMRAAMKEMEARIGAKVDAAVAGITFPEVVIPAPASVDLRPINDRIDGLLRAVNELLNRKPAPFDLIPERRLDGLLKKIAVVFK